MAKSPTNRTDARDRVRGALALSAVGDAIGLPCEAAGLRGEVSEWPGENDAWPLPLADTFRGPEPDPWNIWAPAGATAGLRGVVSDDTAIRVGLVEPWLEHTREHGTPATEDGFIAWLRHRPPDTVAWLERVTADSTRQWLGMFDGPDQASSHAACGNDNTPCFYRPGEPACFGYFLYLGLALRDTALPAEDVFRKHADFCRLDQLHGRAVTGLLAAWLATTAQRDSDSGLFGTWTDTARRIDAVVGLRPEVTTPLAFAVDELGVQNRSARPYEFLQMLKRRLYDAPPPTSDHSLKPFDPLLQLTQLLACLAYADGDGLLALRLLAHGPGDTDTLAATMGMLAGAQLGHERLLASPCAEALRTTDATTRHLFGRTLEQRVAAVIGSADQHTIA